VNKSDMFQFKKSFSRNV